jgi:redox-sensitive bicupin YhaK (pirin superfamily)
LPRYATKSFEGIATTAGVTLLVGPDGTKDALTINQDAYLSYVSVTVDEPVTYTLNDTEHGVYVFVIEGDVDVSGETLSTRDAIGIIEVSEITLTAKSQRVTALIIEVPVD